MINTQLPTSSQSVTKKSKKSSKKNSKSSVKVSAGSSHTVKSDTGVKKRSRTKKTKRSLKKVPSKTDTESSSSESSGSETSVLVKVQPKRKRTKRSPKKRVTESAAESLVTLGRAYGNNVSKLNVVKVSEQPQLANKLAEQTSAKKASREYGDYFSGQTGLSYFESNRVDIITSKGIKRFTDEYTKKLMKCQEFEKKNNVQPFASDRLELLNKTCDGNSPKTDAVDESTKKIDGDKSLESVNENTKIPEVANDPIIGPKNISAAALKTIEIIKKFKSGQSIETELNVGKKNESQISNKSDKGQRATRSGTIANKNRSSSKENEKILTKQTENSDKTISVVTKKTDEDLQKPKEKSPRSSEKSSEKSIVVYKPVNKNDKSSQGEEEKTSEKSVVLSRGSTGSNSDSKKRVELSDQKENLSEKSASINSQSSFVVLKKLLLSSENTVTIVEGRNRYNASKRSVETHVSGRTFPSTSRSSTNKDNNLKSIETLYRTEGSLRAPREDENRAVARRSK